MKGKSPETVAYCKKVRASTVTALLSLAASIEIGASKETLLNLFCDYPRNPVIQCAFRLIIELMFHDMKLFQETGKEQDI